jgi:hypothetical protein
MAFLSFFLIQKSHIPNKTTEAGRNNQKLAQKTTLLIFAGDTSPLQNSARTGKICQHKFTERVRP